MPSHETQQLCTLDFNRCTFSAPIILKLVIHTCYFAVLKTNSRSRKELHRSPLIHLAPLHRTSTETDKNNNSVTTQHPFLVVTTSSTFKLLIVKEYTYDHLAEATSKKDEAVVTLVLVVGLVHQEKFQIISRYDLDLIRQVVRDPFQSNPFSMNNGEMIAQLIGSSSSRLASLSNNNNIPHRRHLYYEDADEHGILPSLKDRSVRDGVKHILQEKLWEKLFERFSKMHRPSTETTPTNAATVVEKVKPPALSLSGGSATHRLHSDVNSGIPNCAEPSKLGIVGVGGTSSISASSSVSRIVSAAQFLEGSTSTTSLRMLLLVLDSDWGDGVSSLPPRSTIVVLDKLFVKAHNGVEAAIGKVVRSFAQCVEGGERLPSYLVVALGSDLLVVPVMKQLAAIPSLLSLIQFAPVPVHLKYSSAAEPNDVGRHYLDRYYPQVLQRCTANLGSDNNNISAVLHVVNEMTIMSDRAKTNGSSPSSLTSSLSSKNQWGCPGRGSVPFLGTAFISTHRGGTVKVDFVKSVIVLSKIAFTTHYCPDSSPTQHEPRSLMRDPIMVGVFRLPVEHHINFVDSGARTHPLRVWTSRSKSKGLRLQRGETNAPGIIQFSLYGKEASRVVCTAPSRKDRSLIVIIDAVGDMPKFIGDECAFNTQHTTHHLCDTVVIEDSGLLVALP